MEMRLTFTTSPTMYSRQTMRRKYGRINLSVQTLDEKVLSIRGIYLSANGLSPRVIERRILLRLANTAVRGFVMNIGGVNARIRKTFWATIVSSWGWRWSFAVPYRQPPLSSSISFPHTGA